MLRIIRLCLFISGVSIVAWNLSAYRSNIRHRVQVEQAFEDFTKTAPLGEGVIDEDVYVELSMTKFKCSTTDGLYDGWNHRIPKMVIGGILIIGGFLSFKVSPKKQQAEQVAAPDR